MTADDFRAALEALGFTQLAFARAIDVAERTVRRWATGDQPVPRSVVILLALMRRHGLTGADLEAIG